MQKKQKTTHYLLHERFIIVNYTPTPTASIPSQPPTAQITAYRDTRPEEQTSPHHHHHRHDNSYQSHSSPTHHLDTIVAIPSQQQRRQIGPVILVREPLSIHPSAAAGVETGGIEGVVCYCCYCCSYCCNVGGLDVEA